MRNLSLLLGPLCWLGLGGAASYGQTCSTTAFGKTTALSMPLVTNAPFFMGDNIVSVMGSLDIIGQPAKITGTTVVNGDFRIRDGATVTVSGYLYVYGDFYTQDATLNVLPDAEIFVYGDKWVTTPGAVVTGNQGLIHVISPRPAFNRVADFQRRPNAKDGLPGNVAYQQCIDGSNVVIGVPVELRSATQVNLADLNADAVSDFSLSSTLTLAANNAPLVLGNNNLVLDQRPAGATGVIDGYTELRYAQTSGTGTVKVVGLPASSTFVFPIGNGATGDYTPAQITNTSSAPATASMSVGTSAPTTSPNYSAGRTWQFVGAQGTSFDVALQHNSGTQDASYDDTKAAIVASNGVSWEPVTSTSAGSGSGTITTGAAVAGATVLARAAYAAVSSPAYLQKQTAATPLPVSLVSFEAKRTAGTAVRLAWVTASELNNAGFEVQRSENGTTWAKIGTVAGNGTTTLAHSYSLLDNTSAAAYYRLLQKDTNGKGTYSPVRSIGALSEGFAMVPNPAKGQASISGHDTSLPVELYNSLGQVARVIPAGQSRVDVANLPAGVYILRQGALHSRVVVE